MSNKYPENLIKMCKDFYGLTERIEKLKKCEFIVYIKGYHIDGGDYEEYWHVKSEGEAYIEEKRQRAINSVLIPIIVSLLVNILTKVLTENPLPNLLQQKLQHTEEQLHTTDINEGAPTQTP